MNRTLAIVSSMVVIALAGCSSQTDRKTASGTYKYLETKEQNKVRVPADLDAPTFSREFAVPELDDSVDESLVGKKLLVQSPALVLPLVTGSHVEEGKSTATIWFDQVDDSQPLSQAVWNSLLSFLDEQGIGVDFFDPEQQVLNTDWMIIKKEVDSPWYKWTSTESEVGRRFEFVLDVKPHGRSAALSVDLKDYMATTGDDVVAEISSMQERREEVDVLNQVIGHYEYQIQLQETRRIARIRQGLNTEMGFNDDGNPAFMVDAQYDVVWPRMLLVLRKLGFDVKDLDKSNGLLFVSYNGSDTGWWGGLFSSDNELLEKGDYRLKVSRAGEKRSSVTFMNNESEPFEANQVSDLYGAFAEVMSEDNLDI
ncbi:outer membrane protein assembly factor BamC [Alteromonas stellipolaris]|uniref:outer membrane protein assembly factor BamC n=1 Tax=Alteromonas TaxID=226 RepID=UPI0007700D62|nr:outer membrane protein assembly factor BamC [Alteromonas stellipolaris]AMJ93874.1 outer membrane assembly protein BamC [Alteromonas stellipolaris]ANB22569.1 outer membrane assembly protein BamC [Alteromonas stellipolaris]ANB27114.1 outer membrane assembly protein BamC [Alteromonas stellipolaris]MDO6535243.1 outer membrane protein assembly factor BamC [Alteromonas stellipolaris]MDO6537975.1 outer membrane protein assembly factor BamC [Alteromonas stellipolaris]